MTEEMIKSITAAEETAAGIRQQANERATQILAQAELQATRSKQSSEEVCRAYKETQIKLAHEDAQNAYHLALSEKFRESQAYCGKIFQQNADATANEIVRRIVSGDC